jgi:hypothetical protein
LEEIKMLVLALQFSKGDARGAALTCRNTLAGSPMAEDGELDVRARPIVPGAEGSESLKTEEKIRSWLESVLEDESYDNTFTRQNPPVHQLGFCLDRVELMSTNARENLLRKEVIQPHLPVRLPCYDFTPITDPTFDGSFLAVRPPASGVADFRGVTGGVYKARERIHPGVLIRDY